jgi:HK97 family phage prohead protease
MRLYGNIQKVDAEQRIVAGYASTECVDAHGEVVLKSAIEAALEDYLEYGNLREMHQLSAVGVTEEASVDDRGLYICAKVTDDVAWAKVTSGTYKGFSIGGRTLARDKDNKKIITKIALNEISLVDRPSNPEAKFDVWKAAGADSITKATSALDKIDAAVATMVTAGTFEKSLYHVGRLAELLESIAALAQSAEYEAEIEADDSQVPARIRDWIKQGAGIFKAMAREEVNELVAAAKVKKAASADDLGRSVPRGADLILKAMRERDDDIDRLNKRINELLAEPAPPKTAGAYGFVAVSKEQDAGGGGLQKAEPNEQDLVAALQAMPEEERALLLIKAARQLPRPAMMVPTQ